MPRTNLCEGRAKESKRTIEAPAIKKLDGWLREAEVTKQDVADMLGVSAGDVYHHFRNGGMSLLQFLVIIQKTEMPDELILRTVKGGK